MSRSTEGAQITTRAARERLAERHEPYWRTIEGGLAVGYRKGVRGGAWFARLWEAVATVRPHSAALTTPSPHAAA